MRSGVAVGASRIASCGGWVGEMGFALLMRLVDRASAGTKAEDGMLGADEGEGGRYRGRAICGDREWGIYAMYLIGRIDTQA